MREVDAVAGDGIDTVEFLVTASLAGEHRGYVAFEGKPVLPLSSPAVFGGDANCYSPQELFVAAVTSCFLTTFTSIAKRSKVTVTSLTIEGRGIVHRDAASGWRFTDVFVVMHIGVPDAASKSATQRAAELTEKYCMVSRSVKSQVHLDARVSVIS
jgi:organic hydroperoxide reductase OsmC/OhrA